MERITMLGTGNAMVTKCYNTCFTLFSNNEYFLVDTGGGNTILTNLEKADISINKIHNVFITHNHNDHITGIVWIVRAVAQQINAGNYDGVLNIYGHKDIISVIDTICRLILQDRFTKHIGERILYNEVEHNSQKELLGLKLKFFDIGSKKQLQFGFTAMLSTGKKLTFLGDEPYRDSTYEYCQGADYLIHEAFCMYSQRDIFHPYEKHHSTVKEACENAAKLKVRNLIICHTEDKNISKRKELYTEEGRQYFNGTMIVPDDLETINLY